MNRSSFFIFCIFLLLLCSCNDNKQMESFVEKEDICLVVGRDEQFRYNPLTCQIAFSRERKTFRIQTDNTSDFFVAQFSDVPSHLGETVKADITWTTFKNTVSRKNLTLEVIKTEGEKIWLWSNSARIGMSIIILE